MYIYKCKDKNNFNFYYVDTTYELDLIAKQNEITPLQLIVCGRLLSTVVIFDNILRRFYQNKTVMYQFTSPNVGIYQVTIDKKLNIEIFIEKPTIGVKQAFGNANIKKFLIDEGNLKVNFYDLTNKCKLYIRGYNQIYTSEGDVAGDFVQILNHMGINHVAVSVGVELELVNNTNIMASGGFICQVKNNFIDTNKIIKLRQTLNDAAPIKDLQSEYKHNTLHLINELFPNNKVEVTSAYNLNQLKYNNSTNINCEKLNEKTTKDMFPILGINSDNNFAYLLHVSKTSNKHLFAMNTFSFFYKDEKITYKLYVEKRFSDYDFLGTSFQLSCVIDYLYNNSNYCATGSIDSWGYVHWVDNINNKIMLAQKFSFKKIYVPLACMSSIDLKINYKIKIKFVENINDLSR